MAITTPASVIDYEALIKEDRIHGRLYYDSGIFEEEMQKIWHRGWVYVGHESEVPEPGDYATKAIGRQPVIMNRDDTGQVNLLLNRCRHRGNTICQNDRGNANVFRCIYHGWTYKNNGELVAVPFGAAYDSSFRMEDHGLVVVPRVESYKGFVFGSLSPTGVSLDEHLGLATEYLDAFLDASPTGEIELRSGVQKVRYNGNWKMLPENSLEGTYHGHFIHQFPFNLRKQRTGEDFGARTHDQVPDAIISLPGGHMVEDFRVPRLQQTGGPPAISNAKVPPHVWETYVAALENRLGEDKARKVIMGGPPFLYVFPNLIMIQSNVRVIYPMSADKTHVHYYPSSLKGAPKEVNTQRLRQYEYIFGPAALVTPDDLEVLERNQIGFEAKGNEWLELSRGMGREKFNADGAGIGFSTDEGQMRGMWRHYKKVLSEV